MGSNLNLIANIAADTTENQPSKVWPTLLPAPDPPFPSNKKPHSRSLGEARACDEALYQTLGPDRSPGEEVLQAQLKRCQT